MEKIRFAEQYPNIFSAHQDAEIVTLPARMCLVSKGEGPIHDSVLYQEIKHLLQGVAFLIKYSYKQNPPLGFFDYTLPPYEIIRHTPEKPKEKQKRTLLLMQPNYVTERAVEKAMQQIKTKNDQNDVKTPKVTLTSFPEKKYIHIHHTTNYHAQKRSINRLSALAKKNNYALTMKQHEIFLKNPLTTPPEYASIIIRYGLKKA